MSSTAGAEATKKQYTIRQCPFPSQFAPHSLTQMHLRFPLFCFYFRSLSFVLIFVFLQGFLFFRLDSSLLLFYFISFNFTSFILVALFPFLPSSYSPSSHPSSLSPYQLSSLNTFPFPHFLSHPFLSYFLFFILTSQVQCIPIGLRPQPTWCHSHCVQAPSWLPLISRVPRTLSFSKSLAKDCILMSSRSRSRAKSTHSSWYVLHIICASLLWGLTGN